MDYLIVLCFLKQNVKLIAAIGRVITLCYNEEIDGDDDFNDKKEVDIQFQITRFGVSLF